MDLTPYVESLRGDLEAAAAAGSDETRETVRHLAGALDASVRLCLLDALSSMAAEVTAATDLASVEIRMHGREPQVVVTPVDVPSAAAPEPPEDDEDGATARVTLRLPEPLKSKVDTCAAAANLSVNAWLVRAVAGAVRPAAASPLRGRRITGYARS
ncbi:MAG: hypothetical protein Q8K58_06780 [Acidimicrobiales bacterium]|nr:hypothetical protein [Acidimicrobiales bacterium]